MPTAARLGFVSEECLITNDPGKYHYVAQGMLTIDNVDDAEEMRITDDAFNVLGFTKVRLELECEGTEKSRSVLSWPS